MSPVSTNKGTRRHHYYVTRVQPGESREEIWRVPAGDIDAAVIRCVDGWIARVADRLSGTEDVAAAREVAGTPEHRVALTGLAVPEQRKTLLTHGVQVQLGRDVLKISFGEAEAQEISLPARLARKGTQLKLVLVTDLAPPNIDPILLKLVTLAHAANAAALKNTEDALVSHYSKRHIWQLLRISWLAPDIVAAIVDGRQPPTLTGRRLLRATDIPLDWAEQRKFFGFG
jgi:hypothetical protein